MTSSGILAARKGLEEESYNRIYEEGILRQIPLVSSVMNWWSPPPVLPALSGRRFVLSSGVVEETKFVERTALAMEELFVPHVTDGVLAVAAVTPDPEGSFSL